MEAEEDRLYNYFETESQSKISHDFTHLLMSKVKDIAEKPFEIKPLITKKSWFIILGIALSVIIVSFLLELIATVDEMPRLFDLSKLKIKDFRASLRIGIGVLVLLSALTLADILYRKFKRIA